MANIPKLPRIFPGSIPFKNVGEQSIPPFAVMVCTGSDVDGAIIYLLMEQPDDEFDRIYYVNGPTLIAKGDYGVCSEGHYAYILFDHDDDGEAEYGDEWGVEPSSFKLRKNYYGFRCLGGAAQKDENVFGDDSWIAIFDPYPINEVMGQLTDDLSYHGAAGVNLYAGQPYDLGGEDETDTGMTITAYDRLLSTGNKIPSGSWVICRWLHGYWYVVEAGACPVAS